MCESFIIFMLTGKFPLKSVLILFFTVIAAGLLMVFALYKNFFFLSRASKTPKQLQHISQVTAKKIFFDPLPDRTTPQEFCAYVNSQVSAAFAKIPSELKINLISCKAESPFVNTPLYLQALLDYSANSPLPQTESDNLKELFNKFGYGVLRSEEGTDGFHLLELEGNMFLEFQWTSGQRLIHVITQRKYAI